MIYSKPYDGVDPKDGLKHPSGRRFIILKTGVRSFGCHSPLHVRTARDVDLGTITTKAGRICSACKSAPDACMTSKNTPARKRPAWDSDAEEEDEEEEEEEEDEEIQEVKPKRASKRAKTRTTPEDPPSPLKLAQTEVELASSAVCVAQSRSLTAYHNGMEAELRLKALGGSREAAVAAEAAADRTVTEAEAILRAARRARAEATALVASYDAACAEVASRQRVFEEATGEERGAEAALDAAKKKFRIETLRSLVATRRPAGEPDTTEGGDAPDVPTELPADAVCMVCTDGVSAEGFARGRAAACKPRGAGAAAAGRHITCASCLVDQCGSLVGDGATAALRAAKGRLRCCAGACDSPPFEATQLAPEVRAAAAPLLALYARAEEAAADERLEAELRAVEAKQGPARVAAEVTALVRRWEADLVPFPNCLNCALPFVERFTDCFLVECAQCKHKNCYFCMRYVRAPGAPDYNDHAHTTRCGRSYGARDYYGTDADYAEARKRHAEKRIALFLSETSLALRAPLVERLRESIVELGVDPARMLADAAEIDAGTLVYSARVNNGVDGVDEAEAAALAAAMHAQDDRAAAVPMADDDYDSSDDD